MEDSASTIARARGWLASALGMGHGGKRDLWEQMGYPRNVGPQQMWNMYLRGGISSRIIRAFPQATWREVPIVWDSRGNSEEEGENFSPFTRSVNEFLRNRRVLSYLERVDRLSSIGQFGALLMGFDDSQNMGTPLSGRRKLLYLSAYGEPNARISSFVKDQRNPRFGMPERYVLQSGARFGASTSKQSVTADASRVIHVAEHLDEDEVYSTPRLLPVYNLLLDLEKVMGSSAETFWLNARGILSLTADAGSVMTPDDRDNIKEQVADLENNLRRTLALQGVQTQMLSTQISDPSGIIDRALDLIAGTVSIPKRILIGSERGELSSSQDENNWAARIDERQNQHASPNILMPFLQCMIDTGNVEAPSGDWGVDWPDSSALSPERMAEIGAKRATALVAYANSPGAELVMPIAEFRTEVMGLAPQSEFDLPDEEDLEEDDEDVQEQFGEDEDPEAPVTNVAQLRRRIRTNASPRSLYVSRPVLNGEEIRDHFRAQGFDRMVPADEMHVTVMYSRTPVDWFRIPAGWNQQDDGKLLVTPGGARMMSLFGKRHPARMLVQQFSASQLSWRHQEMVEGGCSWDWPHYEPHVTITYDVEQAWGGQEWSERLRDLDPWQGAILLGPEEWREVTDSWSDTLVENVAAE